MSFIQKLRDKYVGVAVVAVIVALLGFLLMDSINSNVSNLFGGGQATELATVDGQEISREDFERGMKNAEANYKNQNPDAPMTDEASANLRQSVMQELIRNQLMEEEFNKIGLKVSDAELKYYMTSENASAQLQQVPAFINQKTGKFDGELVKQYDRMVKSKNTQVSPTDRANWLEFMNSLINERKMVKYNSVIAGSLYAPNFLLEAMTQDAKSVASAEAVTIPYEKIDGASIKVTDEDLQKVIDARRAYFQVTNELRDAEYVSFDLSPSSADTAKIMASLNEKYQGLITAADPVAYINEHSDLGVVDEYIRASEIKNPDIANAAVGAVVGPYYDGSSVIYSKILDKKSEPDSVKASHILFDVKNGKYTLQAAQAKADSIMKQIKAGTITFAAAAVTNSDDPSNAPKGGDLGYFGYGKMVPQFQDAAFGGKTGDIVTVTTQFGVHILKIDDQKDFKPSVKLGNLAAFLEASDETRARVNGLVSKFAATAKDGKSFDAEAKKLNLTKKEIKNAMAESSMIPGVGVSRELSTWLFDAKPNDVSKETTVGNQIIVAKLTTITPEGYKSPSSIRKEWEPVVINQKKADLVQAQIKGMDLAAIATKYGVETKVADTVLFAGTFNPVLGMEPKVIGYLFDKDFKDNTISPAIAGNSGIVVVKKKSMNIDKSPIDKNNLPTLRQAYLQQNTGKAMQSAMTTLYLNAKVKNNLAQFY